MHIGDNGIETGLVEPLSRECRTPVDCCKKHAQFPSMAQHALLGTSAIFGVTEPLLNPMEL